MIPEPYRSRLVAAGIAGDSRAVNKVVKDARAAHPHLFRSVVCQDCKHGTPSDEVVNCVVYNQFRAPNTGRECGEFEARLK